MNINNLAKEANKNLGGAESAPPEENPEAEAAPNPTPRPEKQQQTQPQNKGGGQPQAPQNKGGSQQTQPQNRGPQQQPQGSGGQPAPQNRGGYYDTGKGAPVPTYGISRGSSPYSIANMVEGDRGALLRSAWIGLMVFVFLGVINALLTKSALDGWGIPKDMNSLFKTTDFTTGKGIGGFVGIWYWVPISVMMTWFEIGLKPPALLIVERRILPGQFKEKNGQRLPVKKLHVEFNIDKFLTVIGNNKVVFGLWFVVAGFDVLSNVSGFVFWLNEKSFPWPPAPGGAVDIKSLKVLDVPISVPIGILVSYVTALEVEPNIRKFWGQIQNLRATKKRQAGR